MLGERLNHHQYLLPHLTLPQEMFRQRPKRQNEIGQNPSVIMCKGRLLQRTMNRK